MSRSLAWPAILLVHLLASTTNGGQISLHPVSDRSADDRENLRTGALYDGLYDAFLTDLRGDLRTFNSGGVWETRSALVFDVTSIPEDAEIVAANLFLQTTALARAEFGDTRLIVDGYAAENVVRLSDFSAFNPIGSADLPRPLELPALLIDVTGFLRSLQEVDGPFAGFTLRTVPGATVYVANSEWFNPVSRPRLDVEIRTIEVPEPSMLVLAGVGAVMLAVCHAIRYCFSALVPPRST